MIGANSSGLLEQLDTIRLRSGETFHHFVRVCRELDEDLIPDSTADDTAVRFVPTDAAMEDICGMLGLPLTGQDCGAAFALLWDIVRLTQVDMRDLRTENDTCRVALDNFKPDIGSFNNQYLALWHLKMKVGTWYIDGIDVIDERQVLQSGDATVFIWGIQGILSTDDVSARLRVACKQFSNSM